MTRDLLDPSDLTAEKFHHHAVQRPSTRKGAPVKTGATLNRAEHMQPGGKRTDLYRPEDVSGYSPALRGAALTLANLFAKKGKR